MIKNSSLIYKLFNTSCIDRVVNVVSNYSVKLSLEFVNIFIRNAFFVSANLFNYRFLLFFNRHANMMGGIPYITD